jgi:hypothetical protein
MALISAHLRHNQQSLKRLNCNLDIRAILPGGLGRQKTFSHVPYVKRSIIFVNCYVAPFSDRIIHRLQSLRHIESLSAVAPDKTLWYKISIWDVESTAQRDHAGSR